MKNNKNQSTNSSKKISPRAGSAYRAKPASACKRNLPQKNSKNTPSGDRDIPFHH